MDIHAWLHTTEDRRPPDPPFGALRKAFPVFAHLPSDPDLANKDALQYRPKRKRIDSNSSLLLPCDLEKRHGFREERATSFIEVIADICHRERGRSGKVAQARRSEPEGYQLDSEQNDVTDSHFDREKQSNAAKYSRRPRHKTRPDRYEPKPRKQTKERGAHRRPRRNNRGGVEARMSDLVQSFHLTDGPRTRRLTVRRALRQWFLS